MKLTPSPYPSFTATNLTAVGSAHAAWCRIFTDLRYFRSAAADETQNIPVHALSTCLFVCLNGMTARLTSAHVICLRTLSVLRTHAHGNRNCTERLWWRKAALALLVLTSPGVAFQQTRTCLGTPEILALLLACLMTAPARATLLACHATRCTSPSAAPTRGLMVT